MSIQNLVCEYSPACGPACAMRRRIMHHPSSGCPCSAKHFFYVARAQQRLVTTVIQTLRTFQIMLEFGRNSFERVRGAIPDQFIPIREGFLQRRNGFSPKVDQGKAGH